MTAELERRYARLLYLYPPDYREARGAELLETLLESAEEGRTRPAPREVTALAISAFRLRADRTHREPVAQTWLAASRAAALMLLIYGTASALARVVEALAYSAPIPWNTPPQIALTVLAFSVAAVAAGLFSRFRTAAALATIAYLIVLATNSRTPDFWQFPPAVLLLLPLWKHRPPPPAGVLRYTPALPLFLVAADWIFPQVFPDFSGILTRAFPLALCVAALLWLAVDERVSLALGLLFAATLLTQTAVLLVYVLRDEGIQSPAAALLLTAVAALPAAALLLGGAATARRQAKP